MAFPSLENALSKVSNRYLLVVLAAKRARQLNRGAAARVETRHKKPTSSALAGQSWRGGPASPHSPSGSGSWVPRR